MRCEHYTGQQCTHATSATWGCEGECCQLVREGTLASAQHWWHILGVLGPVLGTPVELRHGVGPVKDHEGIEASDV